MSPHHGYTHSHHVPAANVQQIKARPKRPLPMPLQHHTLLIPPVTKPADLDRGMVKSFRVRYLRYIEVAPGKFLELSSDTP